MLQAIREFIVKKEVKKNLKQYSEKYNAADRLYMSRVSKELLEKRRNLYDQFQGFKNRAEKRWREQHARRVDLRKGKETDELEYDDEDFMEYTVQILVESKKEPVPE